MTIHKPFAHTTVHTFPDGDTFTTQSREKKANIFFLSDDKELTPCNAAILIEKLQDGNEKPIILDAVSNHSIYNAACVAGFRPATDPEQTYYGVIANTKLGTVLIKTE